MRAVLRTSRLSRFPHIHGPPPHNVTLVRAAAEMAEIHLTHDQIAQFEDDGFVVVPNVLAAEMIQSLTERFAPLFSGTFETGLQPDEWNWRTGRDRDDVTRQICNAWKADTRVRKVVTRPDIGRACALLRGWPGARINQDNVIWKPPGARALGFHQDDSYQAWIEPAEMMTCWITLDDTSADGGTIEYVRGSHRWPVSPPISAFHAPDDPLADMRVAAAAAGVDALEMCPIEVRAGTAVIHHGRTWHGSQPNRGQSPRRSIVAHCMSSAAQFHPTNVSPIYSRYRRGDCRTMDDAFFPVIWEASSASRSDPAASTSS